MLAIDEDCASRASQPSEQRPRRDIALGDEHARPNRAEHSHVEIAEVIAHQKARWRHRTARAHTDSEHATCETAPAMQPRSACVKTLCSSKERNRDCILNERAEREKYNGAGAPDSEKCRAHRCSRDRRSRWSPINLESGIPATAASFIGENAREQSRAAYEGRAR